VVGVIVGFDVRVGQGVVRGVMGRGCRRVSCQSAALCGQPLALRSGALRWFMESVDLAPGCARLALCAFTILQNGCV